MKKYILLLLCSSIGLMLSAQPKSNGDTWIDTNTETPVNTHYVLYPTTHRGAGTEGSMMIYLPDGYDPAGSQHYPVIYYLHGKGASQREGVWVIEKIHAAIQKGQLNPVIVVCPQGLPKGYYMNGRVENEKCKTGPVEDVIIKDLIPYVDSHYRTLADRNHRALEGFSMGGRGSMFYAFKHPDLFCAASGGAPATVHWDTRFMPQDQEETAGDVKDPASERWFEANHPLVYAKKNKEQIASAVNIRIFVGDADHLKDEVTSFSDSLRLLGIPHSFKLVPGAKHDPKQVFDPAVNDYDVSFWQKLFFEQTRVDVLSRQLKNPNGQELMVIANQGDWHGTTSNSLHALQKAYAKGAQIALVTLQQTKDGEIILFADPTVEKITTGTGRVSDMTLAELRALPLREYREGKGYEAIPTLAQALEFAKNRILLLLNPGTLMGKVQQIVKEQHAENGIIYTGVEAPIGMMYMPVVDLDSSHALDNIQKELAKKPVAVEVRFKEDDNVNLQKVLEMMQGKCRICMNTSAKGLAGSHVDASPRDDAKKAWGALISKGATLILTDSTKGLMNYLKDEDDEKLMTERCGMTDWVDPVTVTPRNTQYVLYPTTQRGAGTKGSFMIYLPMGYDRDINRRYPVIYYFHGMHDSQRDGRWLIRKINDAILRQKMELVIVVSAQAMPQGYYMNGNTHDPKCVTGPIEDVIIKDLIPYVDSHYRTIATREGRGLEGFSMGGRGALMLGFKHPEMFCAISSVSGAVVHWDEEHMKYALEGACGDVENPGSKQFFEDNHPIVFAKKNAKQIIQSGMKLRFFVGTADHLQPIVTRFTEQLAELSIPFSFKLVPEAHHKPLEVFAEGVNDYDFAFWRNAFKIK